jgi:N-acetylgalactosamine-6-sulfatase
MKSLLNPKVAMTVSFSSLAPLLLADSSKVQTEPNIIIIYADDWGWGDLGVHKSKFLKTPNLDKLAKEGTDFQCFHVNSPVCSPSRTALISGQYPVRNGIYRHFGPLKAIKKRNMPPFLNPKIVTLPRMLQKGGYKTGHFGKWHLCADDLKNGPTPVDYGYDEYACYSDPFADIKEMGNESVEKAVEFIEKYKDKKFFINLWIHQPHVPHYPQKKWLEKFSDLDEQHKVYAAVLAEADYNIGKIMKTIKNAGLDDKTLIIFSSDNGPERTILKSRKKRAGLGLYYSVGETGGLRGRKRSLFEGGVGVPFICRWPGKVPAGRINKTTIIAAVDMLPTLCDIAGVKLPETFKPDGEDMADVLKGADRQRTRPLFWEWTGSAAGDGWPRYSIIDQNWKLVMISPTKRVELYDLAADRQEIKNIASEHPEKCQELLRKLNGWIKEIKEGMKEKK